MPDRDTKLQRNLENAVEALRMLAEAPDGAALEHFSERLKALGLPAVDYTPGPFNPWLDPRLGSRANLAAIRVGVRWIDEPTLAGLERDVRDAAGSAEKTAALFGTLAAAGLRIGKAMALA